ncbi:MAG: hypothetical protein ACJ8F4_03055 [Sphingomonas sp.]
MTKLLFALGIATVALAVAAPADARRTGPVTCAKWRHGHCVTWRSRYAVGHRFGPRYGYTTYSALPRTYVRRYSLTPHYRYVYQNGYIYVVDPVNYAITRVLNAY